MSFLLREKVLQFCATHLEMTCAARTLFYAHAEALPDKQYWRDAWGWRGQCGTIEFDEEKIIYQYEYSSHGDTDYFSLVLPLSALYDDTFLAEEVIRWEEHKAKMETEKLEEKKKHQEAYDRLEYQHFLDLKKKYESANN